MDEWGCDGEAYIAAIRAGAIDPFGRTADELQELLDASDREWVARLAARSDEGVGAVAEGRMALPELPGPAESEAAAWVRREDEFTGRVRALQAQRSRLEAEERELLAARFRRVQEEGGPAVAGLREAASIL